MVREKVVLNCIDAVLDELLADRQDRDLRRVRPAQTLNVYSVEWALMGKEENLTTTHRS